MSFSWRATTTGFLALIVLTGCGMSIPADPDGTLDRVRGGELRVGISHHPPWTDTGGSGGPAGSEAELVEEFAASLDADVKWVALGEEALALQMKHGRLDMVIGGLTADTPWIDSIGITLPYREVENDFGRVEKHVMGVPLGENGFLVELETFLLEHGGEQ